MSKALVDALELKADKHPLPYKISWIQNGVVTRLKNMFCVPFSIGKNYQDEVVCDMVKMDASHILLGRPWQFDIDVTYKGHDNIYSFWWQDRKIVLLLMGDKKCNSPQAEMKRTMFAICESQFLEEVKDIGEVWTLVEKGEEVDENFDIPPQVQYLPSEFKDLIPSKLPEGLPPMWDAQHHIDLVLRASLPNLPHYRMSPNEHSIMQNQVEDLLHKGLI